MRREAAPAAAPAPSQARIESEQTVAGSAHAPARRSPGRDCVGAGASRCRKSTSCSRSIASSSAISDPGRPVSSRQTPRHNRPRCPIMRIDDGRDRRRNPAPGPSGRTGGPVGRTGRAHAAVAGRLDGGERPGSAHESAPAGQARRGQDHPGLRRRQAHGARRLHPAGHHGHAPRGPAGDARDRRRGQPALRGLAAGHRHDPRRHRHPGRGQPHEREELGQPGAAARQPALRGIHRGRHQDQGASAFPAGGHHERRRLHLRAARVHPFPPAAADLHRFPGARRGVSHPARRTCPSPKSAS